ncbi:MAG: hypothetical protein ACD_22C00170G0003 [uncultured bacterium]|nr:MAG: hypothetical protein ACD_22C00170G0003 [uncultured bacterium]
MKDLAKWQIVSFISRGIAMVLGVLQSILIYRFLTLSEGGVVQLATAAGAALGVLQHLGLASASTREISAAKDEKEIFKIFITSGFIRYAITVPLALGLILLAKTLAVNTYHVPEMETPLKLYGLVLLIQGFQSILNSVIQGTKRFKVLFIYQALIPLVSIAFYLPLVFMYRIDGYFYAQVGVNLVSSLILGVIAFKPLKNFLQWPSFADFKRLFKELFSISVGIYIVKIIYTNWEKLGPNLLGIVSTTEMVGYFGFALLYAKKLMNISDSVTDVNLPVFSDKYVNDRKTFESLFSENFNKLFVLIVFTGVTAAYWAGDIIHLAMGKVKFDPSIPLVLPIVFAFVFYSFINIIKSSVIVPAKMVKEMIISFVGLIGGTLVFYYLTTPFFGNLMAMAYGMVFGAVLSFSIMAISSKIKLNFAFINKDHALLLFQALVITLMGGIVNIWVKSVGFVLFGVLFVWAAYASSFITKNDFVQAFNIIGKVKKKFNLSR